MSRREPLRICRIATIPFVFTYHLRSQIAATVEKGHEVYLVSSSGSALETVARDTGAHSHPVVIRRSIALWNDLKSLFQLYRYFRIMKFDVVHSITQKAGFLTSLAGYLTRIPIRLHTFTGQPWMHRKGLVRWVAKACDRLIVKLNTKCFADSLSQRDYLLQQRIASDSKIKVLGLGSLAGVELQRFDMGKWESSRNQIRRELNIPDEANVINFTGRINLEKGVRELVDAFEGLNSEQREVVLLLVGPFEVDRSPIPHDLMQRIQSNDRIIMIGDSSQPEKYYAISDLLCLPSYREGFGIVVIEAAAMGIPTIGTQVVGLMDSIIDGKTGILVPPKNNKALREALITMLDDNELRWKMGREAKNHASAFDSHEVNATVLEEYDELSKLLGGASL